MINLTLIQDLSFKIKSLVKESPVSDLDRNIHALIQGTLTKMELISREEYDVQTTVLQQTREKLNELEKKLAVIEDLLQKPQK